MSDGAMKPLARPPAIAVGFSRAKRLHYATETRSLPVLLALHAYPAVTSGVLGRLLGVKEVDARQCLMELRNRGLIRREGRAGTRKSRLHEVGEHGLYYLLTQDAKDVLSLIFPDCLDAAAESVIVAKPEPEKAFSYRHHGRVTLPGLMGKPAPTPPNAPTRGSAGGTENGIGGSSVA